MVNKYGTKEVQSSKKIRQATYLRNNTELSYISIMYKWSNLLEFVVSFNVFGTDILFWFSLSISTNKSDFSKSGKI